MTHVGDMKNESTHICVACHTLGDDKIWLSGRKCRMAIFMEYANFIAIQKEIHNTNLPRTKKEVGFPVNVVFNLK